MEKKKAEKMAAIRRAKGMTQQDLATKAGLSVAAVSNYEQGINFINNVSITTLKRIANVLECDIDDILEE